MIIYQHAKNQFTLSIHSSDTVNFGIPSTDWPHPFLPMLNTKIFNHLLICVKLYQHVKNQLIPSFQSWDKVSFRVQRPDWSHQFLTMPNPELFQSTCKKYGCFIDFFRRNGWFKNPAIWMAENILVYISRTRFFPKREFVQEHSKYIYFLIGIHFMQGWTATTRHEVTRKRNTKRLRHTGNLFRKNLQLKDVC